MYEYRLPFLHSISIEYYYYDSYYLLDTMALRPFLTAFTSCVQCEISEISEIRGTSWHDRPNSRPAFAEPW